MRQAAGVEGDGPERPRSPAATAPRHGTGGQYGRTIGAPLERVANSAAVTRSANTARAAGSRTGHRREGEDEAAHVLGAVAGPCDRVLGAVAVGGIEGERLAEVHAGVVAALERQRKDLIDWGCLGSQAEASSGTCLGRNIGGVFRRAVLTPLFDGDGEPVDIPELGHHQC